ncbi:MAG: sulfatase [Paenibacillaceae bacterium]|nr:sulfatase [Paenibacillaceae bacterium]
MNFLVIICDELRNDAIGFNGNKFVHTPNMDRLAARSVRFANAFTSAPVCSPARHSMISGRYPSSHGVLENGMKPVSELTTVADRLNALQYRSAQMGSVPKTSDRGHGFETIDGPGPADSMPPALKKVWDWENEGLTRRRTAGPSPRDMEYHSGYFTANRAVKLLEEAAANGDKFHFWIGFHEPHPPFWPPKSFYDRFDQSQFPLPNEVPASAPAPHPSVLEKQKEWSHLTDVEKRQMLAGYYGLVDMVDTFVGKILDTLDRLNLTDDTVIIFTADHGEQMGDHNLYTKFVMREPSVRIPLMIAHPSFKPGHRDELVAHVDLAPTLCDLAGTEAPADIHGVSLRPLLEGREASEYKRSEVVSQIGTHKMIRTDEWKLNVYDEVPGELYNVVNDSKEHNNLIGDPAYADVISRLSERLRSITTD